MLCQKEKSDRRKKEKKITLDFAVIDDDSFRDDDVEELVDDDVEEAVDGGGDVCCP